MSLSLVMMSYFNVIQVCLVKMLYFEMQYKKYLLQISLL